MLLWWTLRAIADGHEEAAASVSMLFWFSVRAATSSVAHALHTFGGYGLSNEYDIQLYHRRAKTWGLLIGAPLQELSRAGRRLFIGEKAVPRGPAIGVVHFDQIGRTEGREREGQYV